MAENEEYKPIGGSLFGGDPVNSAGPLGRLGASSGLEGEVLTYLAIPGVSLTQAQIKTLNTNIKAIKYGSGYSLGSVTLYLSLPAGGPTFISGPSVDLRPYSGFLATLNDGSKTLTETLGAAGTGETYGANAFASYDFTSGWSTVGGGSAGGAHVITTASAGGLNKSATGTSGRLYLTSITQTTSATQVDVNDAGIVVSYINPIVGSGNASKYATASAPTGFYIRIGSAGSTTVSALSFVQVLTPSITGVWATVGTEQGSFNRNAAAYTVTITRS